MMTDLRVTVEIQNFVVSLTTSPQVKLAFSHPCYTGEPLPLPNISYKCLKDLSSLFTRAVSYGQALDTFFSILQEFFQVSAYVSSRFCAGTHQRHLVLCVSIW